VGDVGGREGSEMLAEIVKLQAEMRVREGGRVGKERTVNQYIKGILIG